MTLRARDGVLLIAHGTVASTDDLPAFLAEIRRGKPPPPGLVEELRHRYDTIGGSPLLAFTQAQAAALAHELGVPVFVAMRLWEPRVEEVVGKLGSDVERLCVLPLAPFSAHVYNTAARAAFERVTSARPPTPVFVDNWGLEPALIAAHVASIRAVLDRADSAAELVLSAHSLPKVVIDRGDPYARLVDAAARRIGDELGRPVHLAYQSQGADGGEWLGPDLVEVFGSLRNGGARSVVVAPFGFLADHVETLYDVDIEAQAQAQRLGLEFLRVPALNTHPQLIHAMADLVRRAFSEHAS
ncbi:MAG TPA: ferrochelatase [Polyangiaceae bacterium]|nr:ferrochelatase [Polyangiaceae bacterium]